MAIGISGRLAVASLLCRGESTCQLIKEEDLTGIIAANHIIYFPIHYHLLPYLEIFDADQV
jgi:hypothetical protein